MTIMETPRISLSRAWVSISFSLGSRSGGSGQRSSVQSPSATLAPGMILSSSSPMSSTLLLVLLALSSPLLSPQPAARALRVKLVLIGTATGTSIPPFAMISPRENMERHTQSMQIRLTNAIQTSPFTIVAASCCIQVAQVVRDPQSPVPRPAAMCSFINSLCLATMAIRRQPSMFCKKYPLALVVCRQYQLCFASLIVSPK
mmetsp:Transcript_29206/g.83679  ORF Transcript_29206/g.83679 Transcript_29206/m.83679 type:complete len:202 (+) Transcript_29206:474-1079(+)